MLDGQAAWYATVPLISNISDGPSRFDCTEAKRLGGVWTEPIACDRQVSWRGAGRTTSEIATDSARFLSEEKEE